MGCQTTNLETYPAGNGVLHLMQQRFLSGLSLATISLLSCCFSASFLTAAEPIPARIEFNRDIRPILANNCFKCHGPDENKRESDLRLDLQDQALAKRDGQAAIVPGQPAQSALVARILAKSEDEQMPPKSSGKSLTAREK